MKLISGFGRYVEIALAILILVVVIISIISLIIRLSGMSMSDMNADFFTGLLSTVLTLAVGVEFVRMLCKHTADTIVDVLLFATSRQMVVEHLGPLETLLCVLAIGCLFAIRKYLLLSPAQKKDSIDLNPLDTNTDISENEKSDLK